jgi:hypothetical protein
MYIIATNLYEGILEVSSDNEFQRYFGTTTVSISVLDIFFRMLASEEQLSGQALVLPTEYTSMTVNDKGFIYTTIRSTDVENPIRLLNVNGDDIMPEDWQKNPPEGDITTGMSSLTYIDCNEYGMYMVLDRAVFSPMTRHPICFSYSAAAAIRTAASGTPQAYGGWDTATRCWWLTDCRNPLR